VDLILSLLQANKNRFFARSQAKNRGAQSTVRIA